MSRPTRRTFLKQTAAMGLGATWAFAGARASGRVLGANDRIRVAVAGINGRGGAHIQGFVGAKNVEVAALVDVDSRLFAKHTAYVKSKGGNTPKCYQDVRKLLEDDTIDALSIATPNHWHALMTIWGCQAGKHVYVEKPCCHNVFEGRKAVEAARKYNRLVQHGTQQRSDRERANEMAAIHSGKYGKLLVSKAYASKPRWSIGFKPDMDPPAELDYDIWLGPATKRPYNENFVHYNWHWFWDFGNGEIGNQGVHQMDVARWGIKDATLPNRVWSLGGRWVETPDHKDQAQTPNMLLSVFEYGDVLLVFESYGLVRRKPKGATREFPDRVDNEFYTTEGRIASGKFYPKAGGKAERIPDQGVRVTPGGPFGSFIAALRSGRAEDVNVNILEAHYSCAPCHLGNASFRLGQPTSFDTTLALRGNSPQVVESFESLKENLEGVGVKLTETTYQLGPALEFDPKTEKFVDNDAANALLTRPYREGYVVPENV